MYVEYIKLAGRNKTLMWKVLNKEVDMEEPTSPFDHVLLEWTQKQFKMSKDIVNNYRAMFEPRISLEGTEKTSIL